ncbi:MAG: LytR C-terminal domain-containing protein [Actinomycetota bacterium]|nr:LytR C-terminal domain-containing protein [Actinomycetota bacterium]
MSGTTSSAGSTGTGSGHATRRLVARCLLVGLLIVAATACKSSRDPDRVTPTSTTAVPTTSTSTTSTTTTTLPPTTTTTIPLVTTGAVVMVANASTANGAAASLTEELRALGFTLGKPTNGFGPEASLAESKIYAVEGAENKAVADSVSRAMGGIPVLRMPVPAFISGGSATLDGATVLVMLGNDRAAKSLAEMAAMAAMAAG